MACHHDADSLRVLARYLQPDDDDGDDDDDDDDGGSSPDTCNQINSVRKNKSLPSVHGSL